MVIFDGMKQGQVKYGNSTIHYCRWGGGTELLIAIHGFGEDSTSYACIGENLPSEFSLIALDLPKHGSTEWKEASAITPHELLSVIQRLCAEGGIDGSVFGLIGYSMGARIALSLYETDSKNIAQLLLLAPDGLSMHFVYWLSTQTTVGRGMFRWTMQHPKPFLQIASFARRTGIIKESRMRFAKLYLQQETTRKQVYEIWTAFRKFRPDRKKIALLLHRHQTPITLVFGKNDPVIQSSLGEDFRQHAKSEIGLEILDSGHQLLHEKHARQICSLLKIQNQTNLKQ